MENRLSVCSSATLTFTDSGIEETAAGSGGMGGPGGQTSTGDYSINIYGGSFYVNAEGDGLDSNRNISISGGLVEVWGMRTGGDNEPLDYDGTLSVTGGTVFAAGGMGMGMASPSGGSQTYRNFTTSVSSGRTITIKDGSGNVVYSTKSPKNISYIFFSTEGMTSSWTVSSGTGSVSCVCSNAFAHSWDSGEITVEEAGDTGVVTYTCTVCGALSRQTISASAGEEVITSGATGTLGDDDEISYTYTQSDDNQTATVTVSGESVTESTPVLAASYDKDGRFIGLSVITSDGGTAETEADAASVVLFWVDEDGAPLGRAADAAEGTE